MKTGLKHFAREQEGATAVEFALVVPVFLIFLFGIISLTQAFWIRNGLQYAVDDAGRYAMINTTATDDQIRTQLRSKLYGMDSSAVTITLSSATSSGVTYKTIVTTYSFSPFNNGLVSIPTISLSTQARVPLIP